MKTLNGTGRLVAVLALVACTALPLDAAGPKTRYERVLAQATALRLSRRPSPLSQIRKVVAAYEVVARQHPTSGYADNALFHAAELSLAAHRIYGSPVDRESASRMLVWLISEYPHSSLLSKAKDLLKRAKPAPERPASMMQVASARIPASQAGSHSSPVSATSSASAHSTRVPASQAYMSPVSPVSSAASTLSAAATRTPSAAPAASVSSAPSNTATPAGTTAAAIRTPTLKSVTRSTVGNIVRVTMEFDREVDYHQERLDGPARLYFDLKNTQTAAALQDATYSYIDTSVRHIRLGRPKQDTTRLVIDLAGIEKYSIFELYNPYRLTIDLQRSTPKLEPLAARRVVAFSPIAPQLASAQVPTDLDMLKRIPPRPLPHPLADTPVRVTSRPVSSEVASLLRVRPIAGRRRDIPMSTPMAMAPAGSPVAAQIALMLVPPPLSASRRGLPLNAPATRAPKSNVVAAKVNVDREKEKPRDEGAATSNAPASATVAKLTPPAPLPQRPSGPATLPAPSAPSANTAGGFSLARQLGLGVARIVIDPGHGGHDPGNLGSKVNESEVVLDIALRLEKLLLNEPGFEVVMTRRTDVFIPLEERPAIANREQADLFLSIHANASRNRQASGVETYYLNFASNPEAEEVAARENAGAAQTMNHLPEIVRAIAMNNKLDESRDFARVVQHSMVGRLKSQNSIMKDRGVKQAPFVVLIGAGMPSVLAEVAFLSHQQEAGLMKTKDYRQKVAEALFEAVKNYQRSLKAVGTVASIDGDDDDQDEPENERNRD
jgi:N-acetylmuramoyl-L-alanine amidase